MSLVALLASGIALATVTTQPNSPPRQMSGSISDADYPAAAIREGASGVTVISLTIDTSGRVSACSVAQSSGSAILDSTTCSLAQRRFRYRPAMRNGRPVVGNVNRNVRWTPPRD